MLLQDIISVLNCHLILIFFHLFCRIENEIEDLETEEMNISANEELILKRLKEVERTAEDIIKVLLGLVVFPCLMALKTYCSILGYFFANI